MADKFTQTVVQTTGSYAGDYLWSTAANWSAGLPATTDAVSLSLSGSAGPLAITTSVTVASVTTLTGGLVVIAGALNTGALSGTASGASLDVLSGGSLAVAGTLGFAGDTIDVAGTAAIGSLGMAALTVEGSATVGQVGGGNITVDRNASLEVTGGTSQALSTGGDAFFLDGGMLKLDSSVALLGGTSFAFGSVAKYGASSFDLADMANFSRFNTWTSAISGFDLGDSFQLGGGTFSAASYNATSHTISLAGSGGTQNYALSNVSFAADVGAVSFRLSTAADGGTIVTLNCFLAGTRIETPDGGVAVERLAVGDEVLCVEDGVRVARPVCWTGGRVVDAGTIETEAGHAAAPVRIRAHAFAHGIPARDLLVTGDHCIFEAGGLIPARMLVNGASIVREIDHGSFRVHHVGLDAHSILLAEGLTAESFLGTAQGFGGMSGDRHQGCACDPAAPLVTARERVEPVWRRLAARAEALGLGACRPGTQAPTTGDAALCVRLADGTRLGVLRARDLRYFFLLPASQGSAILHSRSAVPCDVEGPFVDDRRRLGVCVRAATLWTDLRSTALALGDAGQPGWHAPERAGGPCWTDGAGRLALPALARPTILEVELAGTQRYPLVAEGDASRTMRHELG